MCARPRAAPMPDELADADAEVRDQDGEGGEGGPADAVLLPDQFRKPLASDRPHPCGHLLDDDQADRDHHHHPEQVVAVLGADRGVGRDASGVIAGVRGDQAGAECCHEQQELGGEPVTRAQARTATQSAVRQARECRYRAGHPPGPQAGSSPSRPAHRLVVSEDAEVPTPAARQHELEHVVDGDHAEDLLFVVDDRNDGEVVIGHQACDLF